MSRPDWKRCYLSLHPQVALKRLEQAFVYHIGRDELYEIDARAEDFLIHCNGTLRGEELPFDKEFVDYCLAEGLLVAHDYPKAVNVIIDQGVSPSLRYLELHLLHQCNLACCHCYLGTSGSKSMSLSHAIDITRQFSNNGGLRLLISGGEPLLYKHLKEYLHQIKNLKIRRVLLTNGTLINPENVKWLTVDEIQFSLDGWVKGHERLRGKGTFARTMQGIHAARSADIPISFSTMVHGGNLDEFDQMRDFMGEINAIEWGIEMPSVTGSFIRHQELLVSHQTAAPFLEYAYGGGFHGSTDGYACGRHLMAVMPDGQAVKCGFYRDKPLGDAYSGLTDCWLKMEHIPLRRLECADCPVLEECRGGCRFRALHPLAPDLVMCNLYGISK